MLLVVVFFLYPMLFQGNFPYYRDAFNYYYYLTSFLKQSIAHQEYPLWNPHLVSGFPQWHLPDPNLIYPFNVLFLLLPFNWAMAWIIGLHHLIAGVGMFVWLRFHRMEAFICLTFGVVFSLSGYMVSLHNNHGFMVACAWMPWCLVALDRWMRQTSIYNFAVMATFAGIHLVCGRPDITYYFAIYVALYVALFAGVGYFRPARKVWVSMPFLLAFIACLASIMLLALWELRDFAENLVIGHEYEAAREWSLPPLQLFTLLVPKLFGDSFYSNELKKLIGPEAFGFNLFIISIYAGIGLLLHMALAALAWRRSRLIAIHLLLFGVLLLFSMGDSNILFPYLWEYLPGLKTIRYPVKAFGVVMLSACFLGACGLQLFYQRRLGKTTMVWQFGALLFFVLVGVYLSTTGQILAFLEQLGSGTDVDLSHARYTAVAHILTSGYWLFLAVFTCHVTVNYFYSRQRVPKWLFQILVAGLFTLDITYHNSDLLWLTTPENWFQHTPVHTQIRQRMLPVQQTQRLYYHNESPPTPPGFLPEYVHHTIWRTMQYSDAMFFSSRAIPEEILTTHGYLAPTANLFHYQRILRVANFFPLNNARKADLLAVMGTHVVYTNGENGKPFDFSKKYYKNPMFLKKYNLSLAELKRTLPRAHLKGKYLLSPQPEPIVELMTSGKSKPHGGKITTFDPWKQVILSDMRQIEKPLNAFIQKTYTPGHWVEREPTWIESDANQLILAVANRKKKFLVVSDVYFEGWRVWVDGVEQPLLLANFYQRAVALPPGIHAVRFEYHPAAFWNGLGVMAVGWGMIFLMLGFTWRQRHDLPGPPMDWLTEPNPQV